MTIRAVANYAEHILREPGGDVNKPKVLLCAFTAKASNLISKYHNLLSFNFQKADSQYTVSFRWNYIS